MKKERVLLLGGNFFPEPTGIGKYNGEMVEWLANQGHDCTVVTTFPYYPQWKIQEPYIKRCYWFKREKLPVRDANNINVIRCPHYIPKSPSGTSRLISEFSFFFSACLVILVLLFDKKYDCVITVAPPFELGLLGILYKMIRGGKIVYHIQDLQIDAARDMDMLQSKTVINILLSIERFILNNADYVSSISKGMIEKVKSKCKKEVLFLPNWVDTKTFYPVNNKAAIKAKYGFQPTDRIILYSGAIGHKQGLEAILRSAKLLENLPDFKFAICGSGPYKGNLIKLKEELNLHNMVFLPLQPMDTFNSFLNMADIHLVLQKKEAGDLFLPSKLSTILSVGGVAIVTANKGTSLYHLISSTDAGILIEPENQQALTNVIMNIDNFELAGKARKARLYAENNLSTNTILNRYFKLVFNGSK